MAVAQESPAGGGGFTVSQNGRYSNRQSSDGGNELNHEWQYGVNNVGEANRWTVVNGQGANHFGRNNQHFFKHGQGEFARRRWRRTALSVVQ